MSDPHPHAPNGSVMVAISERLLRVLPPAFVLLVLMNCAFLAALGWVIDHNADARNALLTRIVERCLLDSRDRP